VSGGGKSLPPSAFQKKKSDLNGQREKKKKFEDLRIPEKQREKMKKGKGAKKGPFSAKGGEKAYSNPL